MNKPKQNSKNNKKTLLIDGLYNYLNTNGNEQLQLKPKDFTQEKDDQKDIDFSLKMKENDFEQYKKDYSSRIDRQLLIIAQNIAQNLFALNNQKYTAFMSRYEVWGYDLTMQQFIINFYLVVKTDNMLRQFVMTHMDKIITATRNVIEKYLIMHMGDFSFRETRTEFNRKKILSQMKQNQQKIDEKLKEIDKKPVQQNNISDVAKTTETNNNISQIDVTPIQQRGNVANSENEIPKILSINQIMNMSEAEKAAIDNENPIPPIEDNLSGLQIGQPNQETNNPPPIQPLNPEEEQEQENEPEENENEKAVEQQILANLRREHPNLQRGINNG